MSLFDNKPSIPSFPAVRDFFASEIIKKNEFYLRSELHLWNGYLKKELSTPDTHPLAIRDISNEISNIKIALNIADSQYWINHQIARAIDNSAIAIDTIEIKDGGEVPLIAAYERQLLDSVKEKIKELPFDHPDALDVFSRRKVEKRRLNSQIRQNRGAIALHLGLVGG